jgi:hypothetical protein
MALAFTANNPWTVNNTTSSVSTGTALFSFNTLTSGSVLVCIVNFATGVSVTSATDGQANTWTVVALGVGGNGNTSFALSAPNTHGAYAGTDYITINFTGGPSTTGAYGATAELTGAATSGIINSSNAATGTNTTGAVSLSTVTSGSAILVYSLTGVPGSADATAGTGYTLTYASHGSTYGYAAEYNTGLSSASGTVSPYFALNGGGSSIVFLTSAIAVTPAVTGATVAWVI